MKKICQISILKPNSENYFLANTYLTALHFSSNFNEFFFQDILSNRSMFKLRKVKDIILHLHTTGNITRQIYVA
jgi:hypothetical protein